MTSKMTLQANLRLRELLLLLTSVLLLSVCLHTLRAQTTLATISGMVYDEEDLALPGAIVRLRNESTGFRQTTATGADGRYLFREVPLGGPYVVSVSYVGYKDLFKNGYTLNQGNALSVDFHFGSHSVNLDGITVVANSLKNELPNVGAATSISTGDIALLPVEGRNFTGLMELSPLTSGSSLAGQLQSSTNYTVDGMTSKSTYSSGTTNRGPYSISMEAIREFEIVTNRYDVTFGRSGGGTISTVTKSGTNDLRASAFTFIRHNVLASPFDASGNDRTSEYSIYQYGGSVGGPIIRDRLHFFFAWDHQRDARPLRIADIHSVDEERRYSVSQETLDAFLDIARTKYGVGEGAQFGSFDKIRHSDALFARLDFQINEDNLLTVRDNFVRDFNRRGVGDRGYNINLLEVYGSHLSMDNNLMVQLRSKVGASMTNDLKLQYLHVLDHGTPGEELPRENIPRAIVENVVSTVDGKEVRKGFQIGGQRYLPEKFSDDVLQLVDNFYIDRGPMQYLAGVDLMYTHMSSLITSEQNGVFYFSGLDDFRDIKPYRFAREVPLVDDPTVRQGILFAAIYGQVTAQIGGGLTLMGGLRGEGTFYFNKPAHNPLIKQELGLDTDRGVRSLLLQPRMQLTWDIGERGTDFLRFGTGLFGSAINNYSMINNLLNDGTKVGAVDIRQDLPVPDFKGYRQDPSTAPGRELPMVSTINMNSPHVRVPYVIKANLSYSHFFSNALKVTATLYGSWTRNNYFYVDRNMVEKPFFTLSQEAGRGVFVPAETIKGGRPDWREGRLSPRVGRVLELISEGRVNQYALVLDAVWHYYRDGVLNVSYTLGDTRDNTSYNGNVANSATLYYQVVDDPRDLSRMNYSNNHFRHKVVAYGALPSIWGVSVGMRFSGIAGQRYSMTVNGNVNGDFVDSNDLAYVFDPDAPSTPNEIADGLTEILNNPEVDPGFKKYLKSSFGKVAERNGGEQGFYGTLDLRLTKDFKVYRDHHIELSLDLFNVTNLLNKAWGVDKRLGSTVALYNIKGFDPVTKAYQYQVRPNAGMPFYSGNPWQIQLGIRYRFR